MADKSKGNNGIKTNSGKEIAEVKETIGNINKVIDEANEYIKAEAKKLEEKYNLKLEIKKIERFGLSESCELEVIDTLTGETKEHKIVDADGERWIKKPDK